MSKRARSPESQKAHDKTVKDLADEYNKQSNKIWVDGIEGYTRPKTYFGKRPDIVVEHPNGTLIIEVETDDSVHCLRAKKQHRAFSNWASRVPSREYRAKIAKL